MSENDQANLYRAASRMRQIVAENYIPPQPLGAVRMTKVAVKNAEGEDTGETREQAVAPDDGIPRGMFGDPKHIGMRRFAGITRNTLWGSLEEDPEPGE